MTPPSWGIPVVVVVGVLLVVIGWWWDRRRALASGEALSDRSITEEELSDAALPLSLPDEDLSALLGARGAAATLPAGLADSAFLTHPGRGVAAVRDALVLVTDAHLDDDRLVLPLLEAARSRQRPLVLMAAGYSYRLLGTLRANAVTGRVTTLPLELADPGLQRRAASLCGGLVVPAADLRSGWLPDQVWGSAAGWVADAEDSWVTNAT